MSDRYVLFLVSGIFPRRAEPLPCVFLYLGWPTIQVAQGPGPLRKGGKGLNVLVILRRYPNSAYTFARFQQRALFFLSWIFFLRSYHEKNMNQLYC